MDNKKIVDYSLFGLAVLLFLYFILFSQFDIKNSAIIVLLGVIIFISYKNIDKAYLMLDHMANTTVKTETADPLSLKTVPTFTGRYIKIDNAPNKYVSEIKVFGKDNKTLLSNGIPIVSGGMSEVGNINRWYQLDLGKDENISRIDVVVSKAGVANVTIKIIDSKNKELLHGNLEMAISNTYTFDNTNLIITKEQEPAKTTSSATPPPTSTIVDPATIEKANIEIIKPYENDHHLPVPKDYKSSPEDYGYSFIPPEKWYPTPPVPPVCVQQTKCPVVPIYTSGTEIDLKQWDETRRITPADDIDIGYVTNVLNTGKPL